MNSVNVQDVKMSFFSVYQKPNYPKNFFYNHNPIYNSIKNLKYVFNNGVEQM